MYVEPSKEVLQLIADRKKIAAIKAYRAQTKLGLREAKAAIEELEKRHDESRSGILPGPSLGTVTGIPRQIEQLAELRDRGILTEEEFTLKKMELLSRM